MSATVFPMYAALPTTERGEGGDGRREQFGLCAVLTTMALSKVCATGISLQWTASQTAR